MNTIGLFGYSFAALAYLVFALLLLAARNKSLLARWVLFSATVMVIVNIVAALQINFGFSLLWPMFLDAMKIAMWSVLILSCNTELQSIRVLLKNQYVRKYLLTFSMLTGLAYLATYWLNFAYQYLFLLFLILNLWSLVLLEQLYRSATVQVRWAIWPLVIGLASMSVFDFVLYAQATMVGGIDFDFWYSRGLIATIVVPFLLISTRRIQNGAVRIFVSRQVVFYSSMLMIAGLYLLVMAFAGYVINYLGGQWGSLISIAFVVLGGIVLAVLLITESLRRKVKVFIAKNFFANKYEYRDEWLQLIEKIEDSSTDNPYQVATQIMMSKVSVHNGALLKRSSQSVVQIKYSADLAIDENLLTELTKMVHYCQKNDWIFDVQEYLQASHNYPELSVDAKLCLKHKIAVMVPVFIGKNFYGLFLLGEHKEASKLNWEDRDLLIAVAKQLGNFISLHEVNDKLAEAKQFDAFNRMSAFLVHDLKNVQAQLALISSNAEKHRDNPDFIDDVFETVESATERLDKVLSQLRNKQLAQSESALVNVAELITQVVKQCNVRQPQISFNKVESCELLIDGETLISILNHLLQNAQEACQADGVVDITLFTNANSAVIEICDNGCGMSAEFIDKRLFKPFDTTKGNAGMGIGVYEAKQFIEGVDGEIKVTSVPNEGTQFVISLPR